MQNQIIQYRLKIGGFLFIINSKLRLRAPSAGAEHAIKLRVIKKGMDTT